MPKEEFLNVYTKHQGGEMKKESFRVEYACGT